MIIENKVSVNHSYILKNIRMINSGANMLKRAKIIP